MRIEISNGYVLLNEVITRKVMRSYKAALFNGTQVTADGEMGGMGALNIDSASEALLLGLAEKVVVVSEGKETFTETSKEWLDNLPEKDFEKLETAVLKIKNGTDEDVKK